MGTHGAQYVYLIRHDEKPDTLDVKDYSTHPGPLGKWDLGKEGYARRDKLPTAFAAANMNIGHIIAQSRSDLDNSFRPEETIEGLITTTIILDTSSHATYDFDSVVTAVKAYSGPGNVLVCWEHTRLTNVANALCNPSSSKDPPEPTSTAIGPPPYPETRFDIIWVLKQTGDGKGYQFDSITTEKTGLQVDIPYLNDDWRILKFPNCDSGWELDEARGEFGWGRSQVNSTDKLEKWVYNTKQMVWCYWESTKAASGKLEWQLSMMYRQDAKGRSDVQFPSQTLQWYRYNCQPGGDQHNWDANWTPPIQLWSLQDHFGT